MVVKASFSAQLMPPPTGTNVLKCKAVYCVISRMEEGCSIWTVLVEILALKHINLGSRIKSRISDLRSDLGSDLGGDYKLSENIWVAGSKPLILNSFNDNTEFCCI